MCESRYRLRINWSSDCKVQAYSSADTKLTDCRLTFLIVPVHYISIFLPLIEPGAVCSVIDRSRDCMRSCDFGGDNMIRGLRKTAVCTSRVSLRRLQQWPQTEELLRSLDSRDFMKTAAIQLQSHSLFAAARIIIPFL